MTSHRTVERADREAVLERQRALKMAKSAHAYVRGNTLKFYQWLDGLPRGGKGYREGSEEIQRRLRVLWDWLVELHALGRPRNATPPA